MVTGDGDTVYAGDTAREQYGPRKGMLVHVDDLDEPGRFDLDQHYRNERKPEETSTGLTQVWRVTDGEGNPVEGGPLDDD